ncbi:MAG: hypothetical protein WA160_14955 [Pseudobdellovibrio sp.]
MSYNLLKPTDLIKINKEKGLRVICNENTVIHCHHYNARLQNTIESETSISGKEIIREVAEQVYLQQILILLKGKNYSISDSYKAIADLYSTMGYGNILFDKLEENIIYSNSSHFVSGWQCGSLRQDGMVCTIPEGFIAAALFAVTGDGYQVNEESCMNEEKQFCNFKIKKDLTKTIKPIQLKIIEIPLINDTDAASNINKQGVIDAVVTLPIYGNDYGLIPMFNVYLANTPQTFYNLVCLKYLEAMSNIGRDSIARLSLIRDAEFCAMNTFSGIMNSDEWLLLIKPMIKEKRDNVFGLIAVANALGWGRIFIKEHSSGDFLKLSVGNGYEAYGYQQLMNKISKVGECLMMTGICSGTLSLIYQKGNFEERVGSFQTNEVMCLSKKDHHCEFHTVQAE